MAQVASYSNGVVPVVTVLERHSAKLREADPATRVRPLVRMHAENRTEIQVVDGGGLAEAGA